MTNPDQNEKRPEVIAERLFALGCYLNDNAQSNTVTGDMFIEAAKHLQTLARATCAQGVIGCYAGPTCTADRK